MALSKEVEKKEFGTEWEDYTLVPLCGKWYFVVGIVKDTRSGERKVRVAKGPMKDPTRKMPSQVQRHFASRVLHWPLGNSDLALT